MKKYFYLFMCAVMSCTATTFTSCSNEEEVITFPIEEELAGSYKGQLKVNVDGQDLATQSQKITVEKAGETSINLSLKKFSFMGINIGDVELADCPLTKEGETYSFTGTTTLDVAPLKADVQATGTIGAGKVEVNMDIAADLGGKKQSVKVVYTGDKLKGTESSEAKITKFIFDRNVAEVDSLVIVQPKIDEENKTITFMVADTAKAEYLKALVPTIEVSEKATVTPGSEVAQDFSNGNVVKYKVEAEDGTVVVYNASIEGAGNYYGFENWSYDSSLYPEDEQIYQVSPWASCNNAVALIKKTGIIGGIHYDGVYPVQPWNESYSGNKAAMLESVDTKGGNIIGQQVPKVTAATIFLGKFDAMAAITVGDAMATTQFGIKYDRKPVKVLGFYKYTPGAEFYNAEGKLVEDKVDECSMSAVLFEIDKDDEYLKGDNIYTSDKIVAQAMFKSNKTVTEYTPFELNLEYSKEYDPTKKYKFTIILSASADGANYNAAVGSKLIVDDVVVVNE